MDKFSMLSDDELFDIEGGVIPLVLLAILIGGGSLAGGFGLGYGLAIWLG